MCLFHSEKRVGNVYSKAKSFVDYVRRALRRLELDDSKVRTRILLSSFNTLQKQTAEDTWRKVSLSLGLCLSKIKYILYQTSKQV